MTVVVIVEIAVCPECGREAILPLSGRFPHATACSEAAYSRPEILQVRRFSQTMPITRDQEVTTSGRYD